MNNKIHLQNSGPIEELTIPLPDAGVVILTGPNGAGKDLAIDAVKCALGGKQKPSKRDGSKYGLIEIPGVTVRLTSSVRRKGEAEVASIGGDLDYSAFVDPKIKDPAAADKERIVLLSRIHGIEADRSKFFDMFGGEQSFNSIASAKTLEATNLVDMARLLKTDLESMARKLEDQAKVEQGKAASCEEQAAGVNLDACSDSTVLQAALEAVIAEHAALVEAAKAADGEQARRRLAIAELEDAKADYSGLSVEDAEANVQTAEKKMATAAEKIAELERQVEAARHEHGLLRSEYKAACDASTAASSHAKLVSDCESIINRPCAERPSDEEIAEARGKVNEAREHLEYGATVRRAKERKAAGVESAKEAERLSARAANCREYARGTLEVLAEAIGEGTFFLREDEKGNPRFMVNHPTRGETYFSELSDGEKWRFVFFDGITTLKRKGFSGQALFPMEQRAWEGLDGANKTAVASAAIEAGVVVVTAQADQAADGGTLHVEVRE